MIRLKYEDLVGKEFVHGSDDCYGIGRKFYRNNWGIELTDYARPDGWWDAGMNLYMDNFYAEGFRLVDEPIHKIKPGDALLVAVRSSVPNHAGYYLGDNKILHHLYGRLSAVTELKGIFRNCVCAHIRHPLAFVNEPEEKIDILDLIKPSKRAELEQFLQGRTQS